VRRIVLLRGINLGASRRVSMPELRGALADAGYDDVRTYVQSGNVVLGTDESPEELERRIAALIADELGVEVQVVARTRDELAEVVARDPLGKVADNPKRYQVTFCSAEPDPEKVARVAELASDEERFELIGREAYAWHPDGVARSKLWTKLAGDGLGVVTTSRNWTTVTKLLELADE
jgi:uncharacterized protein (DUF1697 family)